VAVGVIGGVTGILLGIGIGIVVAKIKSTAAIGAIEKVNVSEVKITEFEEINK
jgi:ABC-type antimicrobial peptide transport system permease subunit